MSLDLSADPALLAGFLDEAEESLAGLDRRFVELEARPEDLEPVNAVFRAVHSLKGNAAFFGFLAIKQLAHDVENVLDLVRKGEMAAGRAAIDLLLAGLDALKALIAGAKAGRADPADRAAHDDLIARLRGLAAKATSGGSSLADLALVEAAAVHLPDDARAALARLRQALAAQSAKPAAADPALAALIALLDAIAAGQADEARSAEAPRLLGELRGRADEADRRLLDDMLEAYHAFHPAMGFDPMLVAYMRDRIPRLRLGGQGQGQGQGQAAAKEQGSGRRVRSETTQRQGENGAKTMRVAEATVDAFLEQVSELLVVGDVYAHLHRRLAAVPEVHAMAKDLHRANGAFAAASGNLQRGIMALRQVPIGPLLGKVPRLVRDVALGRGKDIAVTIAGDDLLVDKSLVDRLDAPLTHIARNAADHGIEAPEARRAAGKHPQGAIAVTASIDSRWVSIVIEDDGKGIDLDAIRRKGEALGMIQPGAPLSEDGIIALIFAPGVSTAAEVTEISGRGVGMDVVKRAIDEAGGAIHVATRAGRGTRFAIQLPKGVTTQIMPGYLVRIGEQPFTIPLERVIETFRAAPGDLLRVAGRGRCAIRHGRILPVIPAGEILHRRAHDWERTDQVLVQVATRQAPVALAVDAVLGVQQVVLRPLAGMPPEVDLVTGSALLGDGSVALVLNLERIALRAAAA